ncbi:TPR-like protein [Ascobolus immersus RN42]|uniref:TPR-like protein n=1 Tax=Ascobolus immersus RN42 TaxID=1160509 RepID=A0A3N4I237_ASCIM|nr:TPR-like protein [Ascobolus immersus RN42]
MADKASLINELEWRLISPSVDSNPETLSTLPADSSLVQQFEKLDNADFESILQSQTVRDIVGLGLEDSDSTLAAIASTEKPWTELVHGRISDLITSQSGKETALDTAFELLTIAIASMHAFLQANATGPPLKFSPATALLHPALKQNLKAVRSRQIEELSVDGVGAYHLMPYPELLALSREILDHEEFGKLAEGLISWQWWRSRVTYLHQQTLQEDSGTLQTKLFKDLRHLEETEPWEKLTDQRRKNEIQARYYIEQALACTGYGLDKPANSALTDAAAMTGLEYALTGILGKRTRFQERDTSQLVVLAKSAPDFQTVAEETVKKKTEAASKPKDFDLNDDTVLEQISFTKPENTGVGYREESDLPKVLAELDPNEQPPLHPLDSAILLLLTETIKNTNPSTGITREEMMPYCERVLQHSTNWEVYTRGLLVRSRLEAYKARTTERGLLQLQALVDQVIADTTNTELPTDEAGVPEEETPKPTTFLPKPKEEESASAKERLSYIHQLPLPLRWSLEKELAERWAHLGGLRSALEIYERLELWPETALCYAATEQEEKGKKLLLDQLLLPETAPGEPRQERLPRPAEAPRMYCILGDIESDVSHYETAWKISNFRYARAIRSIARAQISANDFEAAAESLRKALKINPMYKETSFLLGCCYIELTNWDGAAECFSRVVSIDDTDGDAWANLATALMKREPVWTKPKEDALEDEEAGTSSSTAPEAEGYIPTADQKADAYQTARKNAIIALKRACALKYDNHRVWQNLLHVAASMKPPSYNDMLLAFSRILDILGPSEGDRAVDAELLDLLVRHAQLLHRETGEETFDPTKPGIAKSIVELVEKKVVPLITSKRELWVTVAKLAHWRGKYETALDAYEKAFRIASVQFEVKNDDEKEWEGLVHACEELLGAYESYGPMTKTEGLGAGEGEIAKDWRFKCRSVVRSVLSKGKEFFEESEGWGKLQERMQELK